MKISLNKLPVFAVCAVLSCAMSGCELVKEDLYEITIEASNETEQEKFAELALEDEKNDEKTKKSLEEKKNVKVVEKDASNPAEAQDQDISIPSDIQEEESSEMEGLKEEEISKMEDLTEGMQDVPVTSGMLEQEIITYSIEEASGKKYAKCSLNVRRLPNQDGERIGTLATNQEVEVTGRCAETGWYQITYLGETAYVSNSYLSDEKIVIEQPQVVNNNDTAVTEQSQVANNNNATAIEQQSYDPNVIPVPIKALANYKSLKKKCTDQEFQQAYDIALQIVTPLVGLSQEEQVYGIGEALAQYYITYSDTLPHYNDPYGYLVNQCASCAGCTRTVGLCLNMLGISYEHVNENQWTHQWARAYINGKYWVCDCQIGYYGEEPAPYEHPFIWY